MNKKYLKNKLNTEIAELTPDVLDNVVSSSYIEKRTVGAKNTAKKSFSKRLTTIALSCCAVLIVAGISLGLVFGLRGNETPISNASYVTVSIEKASEASTAEDTISDAPSVSFTADSNNTIETVRADNESGAQLLAELSKGQSLVGKQLAEGAMLIADAAARTGYIDVTATASTADTCVNIKIATIEDVKMNAVLGDIKGKVESYLKQNGIYAYVLDKSYTNEELATEVKKFKSDATALSAVADLTAALATRKPYYEETVDESANADLSLLAEYARASIKCIEEFSADYQIYYIMAKGYLDSLYENLLDIFDKIESLADLAEVSDIVLTAIDFAKTTITNTVNSILSAIPDSIKSLIGTYVSPIPESITELGEFLNAVANRRAEKLSDLYIDAYERVREPISDEAYLEFSIKFSN